MGSGKGAGAGRRDRSALRGLGAGAEPPASAGGDGEGFWNDLYWFVVITLAAAIVAVLVLPPKAAETLELLRRERRSANRLEELRERERVLAAAVEAIQNDPIYREGVLRNAYRLTRASEEALVPRDPPRSGSSPQGRGVPDENEERTRSRRRGAFGATRRHGRSPRAE